MLKIKLVMKYDAIHDFSAGLRTGSNQADINRFQSHTRKSIPVTRYEDR